MDQNLKSQKFNETISTEKKGIYFKDVSEDLGLLGIKATFFAISDLNNDGYSDIVYLNGIYSHPEVYFYNLSLKKFTPAEYQVFDDPIEASSLLIYDFNKDGIKDLIAYAFNYQNNLSPKKIRVYKGYKFEGKTYFKYSNSLNLEADATSSISVLDYDKDGYLDLFVGNWIQKAKARKNYLMKGLGLQFKEVKKVFDDKEISPTLSVSICDLNNDELPEILTTSSRGIKNSLWTLKNKKYIDVSKTSSFAHDYEGHLKQRGGGRTQFSNCYDVNNDGYYDIFLGELNYAYDHNDWDRSSLLYNNKRNLSFRREELVFKSGESHSQNFNRGLWHDFNLDGEVDLLIDDSHFPPYSKHNLLTNFNNFIEDKASLFGLSTKNPSGSVYLDFNKDGKLDILTTQINSRDKKLPVRVYLYENISKTDLKTYKINLIPSLSNIEAIGARVDYYFGEEKRTLFNHLSYGFLTPQNSREIYIHIPSDERIHKIDVYWPSKKGKKTYLFNKGQLEEISLKE